MISVDKIGTKIKLIRSKKGLSQEKLAEKSELSTFFISNLENGKRGIRLNSLIKISEALDEPLYSFFIEEEDPIAVSTNEKDMLNKYRKLDEPFKSLVNQMLEFNTDDFVYHKKMKLSAQNVIKLNQSV